MTELKIDQIESSSKLNLFCFKELNFFFILQKKNSNQTQLPLIKDYYWPVCGTSKTDASLRNRQQLYRLYNDRVPIRSCKHLLRHLSRRSSAVSRSILVSLEK